MEISRDSNPSLSGAKMPIPELHSVSRDAFIRDFVVPNRPCIVRGVGAQWRALSRWTPSFFSERFGDREVSVCDHTFTARLRQSFAEFLANFEAPPAALNQSPGYVRWYTANWSRSIPQPVDDVWIALSGDWRSPEFVPTTELLFPFCQPPSQLRPELAQFPGSILLLSTVGSRTALHTDYLCTDNILIQIRGTKDFVLFAPSQSEYLELPAEASGGYPRIVDLDNPDRQMFPRFDQALVAGEGRIGPGDVLFIPSRWYHAVRTTQSSVSITFAFVHNASRLRFLQFLRGDLARGELEQLMVSYGDLLTENVTPDSVRGFLTSNPPS